MTPLLDTILEYVPAASSKAQEAQPLRFQAFNLAYDNFLGRMAIGRVYEGMVRVGDFVGIKKIDGSTDTGKITKVYTFHGLQKKEVPEAGAGDIVMVAGIPDIYIGETICADPAQEALPAIVVDEPTISLNFFVNDSPFGGRDGKFVTNRHIKERLQRELEVNVGLRVDFSANDFYTVYGRGELHIAILLENMRREGYEVQVSQPHVILKEENGYTFEPFEEVTIDVPDEVSGVVIEKISNRKGIMTNMIPEHGIARMIFEMPTRGLLGYRGEFLIDTRGEGILCSRFIEFRPYVGEIERHKVGSMVSMATGKALAFSLFNLQNRGVLYIEPNTQVYEGMVIGNVSKGIDMAVNPIKGKELTNMRASRADDSILLFPALTLTLERGLEVMNDDEYLEVTPKYIRLRKQFLNEGDRTRALRERRNAACPKG